MNASEKSLSKWMTLLQQNNLYKGDSISVFLASTSNMCGAKRPPSRGVEPRSPAFR